MRVILVAFLTIPLTAATHPALASTLRVPGDYASIQAAIDSATDGDVVLVSPGTYRESIDFLGKQIHVKSTTGAAVTILRPDGGGSVVTLASGEGPDSLLEGFTITGGTGTIFEQVLCGGGVYCFASSPVIRGNVITGNTANHGAGIWCFGSGSPIIEENRIEANSAMPPGRGSGGGIFCVERVTPIVERNEIVGNLGYNVGGGIAIWGSAAAWIYDNTIESNWTEFDLGGGIACVFNENPSHIAGNRVLDNRAEIMGGGIACYESSPTIVGNVVRRNAGNHPLRGGGVYCRRSTSRIDGNEFTGNINLGAGSALSVIESNIEIIGNIFADNAGTPLQVGSSSALLMNCTFQGNSSIFWGGAIICGNRSSLYAVNSIFWNNPDEYGVPIWVEADSEVELYSCSIEGGWDGTGEGNIDADPRFVDPERGDLRLRISSPCVDRGTSEHGELPDRDFEGDDRVRNGGRGPIVDIGVDEMAPEVAVRFGAVDDVSERLGNPLRVNGRIGDRRRIVRLNLDDPLTVEMLPSPAGPTPARFACYAWLEAPDLATLAPQPHGLGVMGFATPLAGDSDHLPVRIWNNLGHRRLFGDPHFPSSPAPTFLTERPRVPRSIAPGSSFTLQGFVEDYGSTADGPISITNAVVVRIE